MSERQNFLQRLDSWFDTRRKRMAWIALIAWIWLFWQTIWTLLISVHLCSLSGYDSLFDLMASLKRFDPALLERLILNLSALRPLTFSGIVGAFCGSLDAFDVIGLVCLFLTCFIPAQKKRMILAGLMLAGMMAVILIGLLIALNAGSLSTVAMTLRVMGFIFAGISLVFGAVLAVFTAKTAALLA